MVAPARRRRRATEVVEPLPAKILPIPDSWDDETPIIELLKTGASPVQNFRDDDYLHVSDVLSKCLRKLALIRKLGVAHTAERVMDSMGVTFAQGDAIHDYVKRRFIDAYPDRVWAEWRCPCGDTTVGPMVRSRVTSKHTCDSCGRIPSRHCEHTIVNESLWLGGSPDLVLLTPAKSLYITEIKSINKKDWEALVRPQPNHALQILFYWWLAVEAGHSVVDTVSVLYVNKEFNFKLPYREFTLQPEVLVDRLEPYFDDIRSYLAAVNDGGPLPGRTMCGAMDAPEAKKCPVCVTCFHES